MSSLLDTLAERSGIEPSFKDALGKIHETQPEKKQGLLRALDLPADDEAQVRASLEQMDHEECAHALPPVVVVYAEKPMQVLLTLPREHGTVRWTLTLEGGGEQSGEAMFESLELVSENELEGKTLERRLLVLPGGLPWGYHRLRLEGEADAETSLIVTPGRCWLPEGGEAGRRFWGVSTQVYLLRSERQWGMGDFTDLRMLVEICRERGADCIGVNPLHAMFLDQPEQASPYSPMSRYLLNVLNIDVEAIPEFAAAQTAQKLFQAPAFQARLGAVRAAAKVDYAGVAALKLPVLQAIFAEFEHGAPPGRKEAFEAFVAGADELLRTGCLYEAIRQYLTDKNPKLQDPGQWPEEYRHPAAEGVVRFEKQYAELYRYHLWLQWVADSQLAAAAKAAEAMAVGIYRDLAVGGSPSGAEVWSNPGVMVGAAEVGAPPDEWNAAGQNWALPPFHPRKMREDAYRSFIALVRTNMRHAGGLRIDHAMSLERLYWIPKGGKGGDGGYVQYPMDDLIGVLALESHRNECLVVGEDLGTVKEGFRERMAEANILSYRVLLFEKDEGVFLPASAYPKLALSTASSHDLPTLRGWWEEIDLDLKGKLGITREEALPKAREEREKDRNAMVERLRTEGLLEGDAWPATDEFIAAAHRFLARTPALLAMAQMDDLAEEPEQVNLPATMPDQYPSWSRRLSLTLEAMPGDGRWDKLAKEMVEERG